MKVFDTKIISFSIEGKNIKIIHTKYCKLLMLCVNKNIGIVIKNEKIYVA